MRPNLGRLAAAFDPEHMDALLLLAPTATSIGYTGRGDFAMASDGRLLWRGERDVVPFVYAGAAILAPALFRDAPAGAFPLTTLFRSRRRGASGSTGCGSKACGCMWARPRRWRPPRPRSWRARCRAQSLYCAIGRARPLPLRSGASGGAEWRNKAIAPFDQTKMHGCGRWLH